MAAKVVKNRELKNIGYELFIGALSILSILNMILGLIYRDPNLDEVLYIMTAIMTPIFLGDFFYRFFTTDSKSTYFWRSFGWADLLSSLPFPQLKILRVFRLWRVIRLFRQFGMRNLVREFVTHRAENALLSVGFLVLCVLEFGSLAVLFAERSSPNANITSALRRHLVGLRDHHDGGLRRSLSRHQFGPARGRGRHDGRCRSIRHAQRLPGQLVLVAE